MKTTVVQLEEAVELFSGSIEILSMAANADPANAVMAEVELHCSGTATGFGQALGIAARAFIDSLPPEHRQHGAQYVLEGFLIVLQPRGAHQVAQDGGRVN